LIGITLLPPPPPPPPPPVVERKAARSPASARKAEADPLGGSPGPKPEHAPPSVTPVVPVQPTFAPSGGGTGSGPALGSGAGGNGHGAGAGGADLELISGDIGPRDYPRRLAKAGIGGTVKMRCTVGPNGRVVRCSVIGSSGVPELDALTPRLIEQRFVYRPATDRYGRPVADDVEIDWTWD
jgi:protein TonB